MSAPAQSVNVVANSRTLSQRLDDYESWRDTVVETVLRYARWLDNQDVEKANTRVLHSLIHSIRDDRLVVAMVGEYSRGKTELINAMFFSEYNCRLLPSSPGRTTMCPTEILHDPKSPPCIRLLPIESRLSDKTVAELKQDPELWTVKPLQTDSMEAMAETLEELVNNKVVALSEATKLGFSVDDDQTRTENDEIEIPVWRHAQINYPHPLLQQGLVILDTPGLNALGSEPELTLRMLPNANAVIFVLAADTGVTQSDLNIWKNHVCVATKSSNRSRIAVLNKIDTLWDELLTPKQIEKNIAKQISETSRQLALDAANVVPVSAVKGLVARIQNNDAMLEKAGLAKLEQKLSTDLIQSKQEIVGEAVSAELGDRVQMSQRILAARIEQQKSHSQELQSLVGKSDEIVGAMIKRLREQKAHFESEVESFVSTRNNLDNHVRELLTTLNPKRFDKIFASARLEMEKSMTTIGLRRSMSRLFQSVEESMRNAEMQSEQIRTLLDQSYRRFHRELNMPKISPARFNIRRHNRRLAAVLEEAENYRESSQTIVNQQHVVIKRFFDSFGERIRGVIVNIDQSARNWANNVLNPIRDQLKEHKRVIGQRLENLESLQANRDSLLEQIDDAVAKVDGLSESSKELNEIMFTLKSEIGYQPQVDYEHQKTA